LGVWNENRGKDNGKREKRGIVIASFSFFLLSVQVKRNIGWE
jgi:hypothetical protein